MQWGTVEDRLTFPMHLNGDELWALTKVLSSHLEWATQSVAAKEVITVIKPDLTDLCLNGLGNLGCIQDGLDRISSEEVERIYEKCKWMFACPLSRHNTPDYMLVIMPRGGTR